MAIARCGSLLILASAAAAQAPTAAALDYFERSVRPLLAERCIRCHGPEVQKSGLRLDHGSLLRKGGSRGPAVVPGDLQSSHIAQAIGYADQHLQMPPKGKLPQEQIAVLLRWIEEGAVWPDEPVPAAKPGKPAFDLATRRRHWCWQPLADPAPPALADAGWCRDPLDAFVLDRQRAAGLSPTPPAEPTALLRRLWFDVVGLPPPVQAVTAFASDPSDAAYAAAVDALLASPQFGVHWARHWLDLVRYAETLGHEYDFEIPNAFRYRDYVVRALNQDLPYDQFVREHIAGDLLPAPRRDPQTGDNESVQATGFWWFAEQTHSPVDVVLHQSDLIANQIDVFGKTFLGVTIACARCHDHKFDAIRTADFYGLYGVLKSTRYVQQPLQVADPHGPAWHHATAAHRALAAAALPSAAAGVANVRAAMLAGVTADVPMPTAAPPTPQMQAWQTLLGSPAVQKDERHPLHAFAALARGAAASWPGLWSSRRTPPAPVVTPETESVLADAGRDGMRDWFRIGDAFAEVWSGPFAAGADDKGVRVRLLPGPFVHSGAAGPLRQGYLQSPTFTIEQPYLHVLAAGEGSHVTVVVEGFQLVRDPIYGGLIANLDGGAAHWLTFDVRTWIGRNAYLQGADVVAVDLAEEGPQSHPANSWLAVQRVVASDRGEPPPIADDFATLLGEETPPGLGELAQRYQDAAAAAVAGWRDGTLDACSPLGRWLAFLLQHDLLCNGSDLTGSPALAEFRAAILALPPTVTVPAAADGTGLDEHVFARGNHRTRTDLAPRCLLAAIGAGAPLKVARGCGRLELADAVLGADDPLPARVLVNRVFHHLFGRGIARTVDNFGALGEPPTHPELLDRLARDCIADGWSLKRLVRRVLLSATYRQGSTPSAAASERDARNDLFTRQQLRRLSGEMVRDALLAVAGGLDDQVGGPPTPLPHDDEPEARGRPAANGPIDGAGRRSLYLAVRRNFLSPFLLAFDQPSPFATVGARSASNVPAQALALWNDPFVQDQCRRWAKRLAAADAAPQQAVTDAYLAAFARPPSTRELQRCCDFLADTAAAAGKPAGDADVLLELLHVLCNQKEFVFRP